MTDHPTPEPPDKADRPTDEIPLGTIESSRFLAETVAAPEESEATFIPARGQHADIEPFGPYTDLHAIGRGGMGIVYRAWHQELKRHVALKTLLISAADAEMRKRFRREAESAAKLDHPGIVPVFDSGETEGRPYFAMAFVEGGSLAEELRENPLAPGKAAEVLAEVSDAIEYAHRRSIVHRDLKPGNILIGKNGRPRVTDFGIARQLEQAEQLTATGDILGTPSYMPPEQATGAVKNIGPASDVYSLGAVLYHMLTGRPPFLGESAAETILQVVGNEAVSPRTLQPALPRDLETICLKCLQKSPAARYASAADLRDDLRAFLNDRPIAARPVSRREKTVRWCRRNRLLAASMVSAVVLLLLLAVGGTWSAIHQANLVSEKQDALKVAADKAAAEEQAKLQAEKRLKHIVRLYGLSTSIFDDLDVREIDRQGKPLESVLAKRLIKVAAELDEADLGDRLAVAAMQSRLGTALVNLGYAKDAIPVIQKSLAIRSELLGPNNRLTLVAMRKLAQAYDAAGEYELAIKTGRDAVRRMRKSLGENARETLDAMNNLGVALNENGQSDAAIQMLKKVVDLSRKHLGNDHRDTHISIASLASALISAKRADEALPLLRENHKRIEAISGSDHPDTLASMSILAKCLKQTGKRKEAEQMFAGLLKRRRARLGADHPDTLQASYSLAVADIDAGRLLPAVQKLKRILKTQRTTLGERHRHTILTIDRLIECYRNLHRPADAVPLLETRLSRQRDELGEKDTATIRTMLILALSHHESSRLSRAVSLIEKTVKFSQETQGPRHPDTLGAIANQAVIYKTAGRLKESLALFSRVRTVAKSHPGLKWTRRYHMEVAALSGEVKVVVDLANELIRDYSNELKNNPALLAQNLEHMASCLASVKEWTRCQTVLIRCLKLRRGVMSDSWMTFHTQSLLGGAFLSQKRLDDARKELEPAYHGMFARRSTIPPAGRQRVAESLQRLIKLETLAGRPADAAKWRQRLQEWNAAKISP